MSAKDKLRDHDVAVFLKTQLNVIHTLMEKGVQFLKDKSEVKNEIKDESLPELQDEWKTLPASLLKEGYVYSCLLHTGQSSLVIQATKQTTSQRVVIKCVNLKEGSKDEFALKELENQYETLKDCKGATNIVQVFEYIKAETCPYVFLVMQECKGTLQQLLDQEQGKSQLSEQSIIKYIRDVAVGLEEAQKYKKEIFDLQPSDILIDYAGNALISRFGRRIARTKGEIELRDMVGESAYVAPECIQFLATSQKDNSLSDLTNKSSYSLGILLYRLMLNYSSSKEKLMNISMFRNQPLSVEQETEQFHYKSLWRQLITDLTHFLPGKRYTIEIALCIINGIYQHELKESISQRCLQQPNEEALKTFKTDIDLISMGSNTEFYPLLKITRQEFENRYSDLADPLYKIEYTRSFQDRVNKHLVILLGQVADREKIINDQNKAIKFFQADPNELKNNTIDLEIKKLKTQEQLEEYGLEKANLFLKYLGLDFKWTNFQEQIMNGDLKDEGDSYTVETIKEKHKQQKIYKLRGPGHNYFEFMQEEELVRRNGAQYALAHRFFEFLTKIKEEIIERKYQEQLAIVAEKKKAEEAQKQKQLEEQQRLLEEKKKNEQKKAQQKQEKLDEKSEIIKSSKKSQHEQKKQEEKDEKSEMIKSSKKSQREQQKQEEKNDKSEITKQQKKSKSEQQNQEEKDEKRIKAGQKSEQQQSELLEDYEDKGNQENLESKDSAEW